MSDKQPIRPQLFSHEYTAPDSTPASAADTDLRPTFLSAKTSNETTEPEAIIRQTDR
ncbi:hypothetical protein [Nocardia nova]|uniref:hypothetical protein n=1 Tax=Nocardia nova TaxID=37330 RepID=UPI0015E3DC34|nr:hypothetical protein [Nocardia nova]